MKIDKTKFKDSMGRPLTQSLFLEFGYNVEFAYYTIDDEDKTYEGRIYPSLKKLYLNMADPIEYEFATTYLLGWNHWEKMQGNKMIMHHIEEWRKELDLKLRSEAFRMIVDASEDNYQAAKFLSEKGWEKNSVGRPKKKADTSAVDTYLENEFAADIVRMDDWKK